MTGTVAISLNVIERFNLSKDEVKQLIAELQATVTTEIILPEQMTDDEIYAMKVEEWLEDNYLYPPIHE